jgi:hypothetical protein
VAPKSTEVEAKWSKEFPEVFRVLKEQGFNPSQWFIPTKEQLKLAYRNVPNEFSSTTYWSSTESNATFRLQRVLFYWLCELQPVRRPRTVSVPSGV